MGIGSEGTKGNEAIPHTRRYKELTIDEGYRTDMVVNEAVILELKCVDFPADSYCTITYVSQNVLTYLKMTGLKLGLLLNFKVDIMRNGIKRLVNRL